MMASRWIWTHWRVLSVLMLVSYCLAACAGYPSEPKRPYTGADEYTLNEDEVLVVAANDGVLVNDTPEEGTAVVMTTLGELPTQNGGVVIMAEDGGFTYTPPEDFSGTDMAVYTVRNEKNQRSTGIITLNVTPVNDPPAIAPIADQTVPQNSAIDISFTVSDKETASEDLILSAASDNETLVPNNAMAISGGGAQRLLTVRPASAQFGRVRITIIVSDGTAADDLRTQATFRLTIAEVNTPPTIAPILDQTTPWMTAITIPILIGDQETPLERLELSGSSSDQNAVSEQSIAFSGSGPNRTLTITPGNFTVGSVTIRITVSDSGDSTGGNRLSAEAVFTLTIQFPIIPFSSPVAAVLLTTGTPVGRILPEEEAMRALSATGPATGQERPSRDSTQILQDFFQGEVRINADGAALYTLPHGFIDADLAADGRTGQVFLDKILPDQTRPLPAAQPDHYATPVNIALEISADQGLLANDIDPFDRELTIADPGLFDTLFGGTVRIWNDGRFSYQPPLDFQGTDAFIYRVTHDSATAGVAIIAVLP